MLDTGALGGSRRGAVGDIGVPQLVPPPPGTLRPATAGALVAGRYRLRGRIGAGGMATIFHARDELLERDVAVKLLHPHLADEPDVHDRFRSEARHAARLVHPHIVGVYDQGVTALDDPALGTVELPYLVLELVDGPSLRDVLAERGRLSAGEALAVVVPVAAALARAHANGVVHRDVKPENVLVASDGTVKVADFGIARALTATRHTATGTLVGSVHYLAPELVTGGEASPASDQYALGVVLFELVTGRKPLPADSPMGVALRHARERVPAPSAAGGPERLDDVVTRATAPDPAARFPDVAAFVTSLRAAVPDGAQPVAVAGPGREPTLTIPSVTADTISLAAAADLSDRRARVPSAAPDVPAPVGAATSPRRAARRRPRPAARLGAALLPLLALALIGAVGWLVYDTLVAPPTPVPSIVGLSEDAAVAALAEHGFETDVTDAVPDRGVEAGDIAAQEPQAQQVVRRGGVVTLVPSSGPAEHPVPEVVGLSRDDAVARLAAAPHFLRVRIVEAYDDDVPVDVVAAQTPDAGVALAQDGEATVTVSLGVEPVRVPDVEGLSREDATAAVEAAGLRAEVDETFTDAQPDPGVVVAQRPVAEAEVERGTTVAITVSAGSATVRVPSVVGRDVDDALDALDDAGLDAVAVEEPRPTFGPFRTGRHGRVEAQLPEPGTRVDRGSTVEVVTYSAAAEEQDGQQEQSGDDG